ncbi:MAG: TetR/AcrR family transcriptional regulator [Clostridia bacterium]|nr:TetR/AcrR family transcriptional regulator [Clostridia bacterium]
MEQQNDGRRVRMTKMLLKSSLIDIMKTKSIHTISIKEICEGADVNRSTFYRHYDTQYDLYDDIIEDIAADIAAIHNDPEVKDYTSIEFLTKVLEYIENNREKFLVILSDKGKISLGEAFTRFTNRFIDHESMSDVGLYVTQFLAAGLTSTMWTWLNKEIRRSPRELASLLYSIIMHGLGRAMKYSASVKEELEKRSKEN